MPLGPVCRGTRWPGSGPDSARPRGAGVLGWTGPHPEWRWGGDGEAGGGAAAYLKHLGLPRRLVRVLLTALLPVVLALPL